MGSVQVLSEAATMALIEAGVVGATIDGAGVLELQLQGGGELTIGNVKDHGTMLGLADDDHTQYAKADGTRGDFATVAQGTKADASRLQTGATIEVTGADGGTIIEQITITDDATATTGWPNRWEARFKDNAGATPRRTMWVNEAGEIRGAPSKHNTTAARWFVVEFESNVSGVRSTTIPIIEMMDNRDDRNSLWAIVSDGTTVINGLRMAYVLHLDAVEAVPAGTPIGTVIVRDAA